IQMLLAWLEISAGNPLLEGVGIEHVLALFRPADEGNGPLELPPEDGSWREELDPLRLSPKDEAAMLADLGPAPKAAALPAAADAPLMDVAVVARDAAEATPGEFWLFRPGGTGVKFFAAASVLLVACVALLAWYDGRARHSRAEAYAALERAAE